MFKSKKLSKFKMIRHGFFNRFGGVSKGIYKGLNCGLGSYDKIRDVEKKFGVLTNCKVLVLLK